MATVFASPEPDISVRDRSAHVTVERKLAINLAIDVDAETRRIFQALTVPEYIEAWITFPGQTGDSVIRAVEEGNGYRLDHYSAGRRETSIRSAYLFRHNRKMRMFWEKTQESNCDASLVDFRLRGNFGSSLLELRHTAIKSCAELDWHTSLWQDSLARLASLLGSA